MHSILKQVEMPLSFSSKFARWRTQGRQELGICTDDCTRVERAIMYLVRVLDPKAHAYRVQYAIARILRDRLRNEGTFRNCFEMEDKDKVVLAILRRGLKNPKLRRALEASHLVNLNDWLVLHPEYSEAYYDAWLQDTGQEKPPERTD